MALPAPDDRTNDPVKLGFECFIRNGGHRIERATDIKGFTRRLNNFGDGARFLISQKMADTDSPIGHTYIAERQYGKIIFIDPQKNKYDVNYRNNVRSTNGVLDLQFMLIDNAILSLKINFNEVVKAHTLKSTIDKSDAFSVISNMYSKMTIEEARVILQNSKEMSPFTNGQGITWYYQLSEYSKVLDDGNFAFVVYPHSGENPIDPSRAYMYFVRKDSGQVERSTVHMCDHDFEYMGAKK